MNWLLNIHDTYILALAQKVFFGFPLVSAVVMFVILVCLPGHRWQTRLLTWPALAWATCCLVLYGALRVPYGPLQASPFLVWFLIALVSYRVLRWIFWKSFSGVSAGRWPYGLHPWGNASRPLVRDYLRFDPRAVYWLDLARAVRGMPIERTGEDRQELVTKVADAPTSRRQLWHGLFRLMELRIWIYQRLPSYWYRPHDLSSPRSTGPLHLNEPQLKLALREAVTTSHEDMIDHWAGSSFRDYARRSAALAARHRAQAADAGLRHFALREALLEYQTFRHPWQKGETSLVQTARFAYETWRLRCEFDVLWQPIDEAPSSDEVESSETEEDAEQTVPDIGDILGEAEPRESLDEANSNDPLALAASDTREETPASHSSDWDEAAYPDGSELAAESDSSQVAVTFADDDEDDDDGGEDYSAQDSDEFWPESHADDDAEESEPPEVDFNIVVNDEEPASADEFDLGVDEEEPASAESFNLGVEEQATPVEPSNGDNYEPALSNGEPEEDDLFDLSDALPTEEPSDDESPGESSEAGPLPGYQQARFGDLQRASALLESFLGIELQGEFEADSDRLQRDLADPKRQLAALMLLMLCCLRSDYRDEGIDRLRTELLIRLFRRFASGRDSTQAEARRAFFRMYVDVLFQRQEYSQIIEFFGRREDLGKHEWKVLADAEMRLASTLADQDELRDMLRFNAIGHFFEAGFRGLWTLEYASQLLDGVSDLEALNRVLGACQVEVGSPESLRELKTAASPASSAGSTRQATPSKSKLEKSKKEVGTKTTKSPAEPSTSKLRAKVGFGKAGAKAKQVVELKNLPCVIGSKKPARLLIKHTGVQPQHLRLFDHKGHLAVQDLTGQGIRVNGGKRCRQSLLKAGDQVQFGEANMEIVEVNSA